MRLSTITTMEFVTVVFKQSLISFIFYIVRIIGVTFSEVFFVPLLLFTRIILTKRVWKKHEKGKDVKIDTNCVSFCLFIPVTIEHHLFLAV